MNNCIVLLSNIDSGYLRTNASVLNLNNRNIGVIQSRNHQEDGYWIGIKWHGSNDIDFIEHKDANYIAHLDWVELRSMVPDSVEVGDYIQSTESGHYGKIINIDKAHDYEITIDWGLEAYSRSFINQCGAVRYLGKKIKVESPDKEKKPTAKVIFIVEHPELVRPTGNDLIIDPRTSLLFRATNEIFNREINKLARETRLGLNLVLNTHIGSSFGYECHCDEYQDQLTSVTAGVLANMIRLYASHATKYDEAAYQYIDALPVDTNIILYWLVGES